jgi:fatty acyl-ACP thioesterase A
MLNSLSSILKPAPVAPVAGSARHFASSGEGDARLARVARETPRRGPLVHCASTTASPDIASDPSPRPSCWKEHWAPPGPSKFIKDKRAFVEEHRWVPNAAPNLASASFPLPLPACPLVPFQSSHINLARQSNPKSRPYPFRIRGYEVGPDQHASIVTMANLLQEVASNHAVGMWGRSAEGFATDPALAELGLIFVMTRMQIQMEAYPRWGDTVHIETWFQDSGKLVAQRDWLVTDAATGKFFGKATSTWVMINLHTRRLSKMPESMRRRCAWYQMDPPDYAIPQEHCRLKIPEVPVPHNTQPAATTSSRFVARRGDMDMNGHINNAVYFAWGLETVPEHVYEDAHLYQMEVDFKAECLCGDVIEAHGAAVSMPPELAANGAGPGALTYAHTLQRAEEGGKLVELVRARTIWRVGDA